MHKRIGTALAAALCFIVIILDSKTAYLGASEGLELCLRTIIPTLLPFFLLSILLVNSLSGCVIPTCRQITKILGIPKGAETLLLVGILGGYPTGAQAVAQAHRNAAITRADAERMLSFCNLAGPSFLFGILSNHFSDSRIPWILWGIQLCGAFLTAAVLPKAPQSTATLQPQKPLSVAAALQRSLHITASVCGWILIFRVLLAFASRWFLWLFPIIIQIAIRGFVELANGCCQLSSIPQEGARFLVCSAMLSFGGLSVTMQTASATQGLRLYPYLRGKVIQTIFCILLAVILQTRIFHGAEQASVSIWLILSLLTVLLIILKSIRKNENFSSIPARIGVY